MITLQDLITKMLALPAKDLELIGQGLAFYSPSQAERLKNAISFGQQEMDALENRERQYEMMSREEE